MSVDYLHVNHDFIDEAKELVLYQFRNSPNYLRLVEYLVDTEFDVHALAIELVDQLTLEYSTGVWLDEIGAKFNVPRDSTEDDQYRQKIRLIMSAAKAERTVDGVIDALQAFLGTNQQGQVSIYTGFGYLVEFNIDTDALTANLSYQDFKRYVPVMTNLAIVETVDTPFGFEGDAQSGGMSSIHDLDAGGTMSSLWSTG